MDRSHCKSCVHVALRRALLLLIAAGVLLPSTGCVHKILATAVWVWRGNAIDADYEGLEGKRVVVLCAPPASLEFRHGGADRELIRRVCALLGENVKDIDVVPPADVENWTDEQEWDNRNELAKAVDADMVVHIDLEAFSLLKHQTLYQGQAEPTVTVYDMEDGGKQVWQKSMGEVLYPINSAVPAQEKPIQNFRREFIEVLSNKIARHFYKHEARLDFASDGIAHR